VLCLKYKYINTVKTVWIRRTPPISQKKFSYPTENVGTCKLQRAIMYTSHLYWIS